jgi:hypothetical protein
MKTRFCLITEKTEPRDMIFIVFGARMPLVLRIRDTEELETDDEGGITLDDQI